MTLTKQEKAEIVQQHIKNLSFNKYNTDLSIIEENAAALPNKSIIDSLESQLSDLNSKIAALTTELDSLEA